MIENYIAVAAMGTGVGLVGKIVYDWLKMGRNGTKYLTKEMHEFICSSVCMKFNNHVQDEITKLKDNYLDKKFSQIYEAIKKA